MVPKARQVARILNDAGVLGRRTIFEQPFLPDPNELLYSRLDRFAQLRFKPEHFTESGSPSVANFLRLHSFPVEPLETPPRP